MIFSVGALTLAMLLCARPFELPIEDPDRNAPDFKQKYDKVVSFSNKMKKDSAYAKNICVGFGHQLKQILLKLIDPVLTLVSLWISSCQMNGLQDILRANRMILIKIRIHWIISVQIHIVLN
jgi:hypothetical protein